MPEVDLKVGGVLKRLRLDQLEPDAFNPRLRPAIQRQVLPPAELYPYLDRAYDVVSIAESINRHGYFEAEPLIAVPKAVAYPGRPPEPGDRDCYVVVEGNRRLTALKGLSDPTIRASLKTPGWKRLPDDVPVPADLPVLVVDDRDKAAPILGFRHITRAAPWEPLPQAKYIADLIDDQERSFAEVADLLSRPEAEVRSFYRNYWIWRQAEENFSLPDAERIADNFGTFTRAMQNPKIRNYIGADGPKDVDPEYLPLAGDAKKRLAQLVTWMFGTPRKEGAEDSRRPRPGQVLLDSRQITALGRALDDQRSRAALEAGASLDGAQERLRDPQDSLLRALRSAEAAIHRALENGAADQERLQRLLSELEAVLSQYDRSGHG